MNALDAYLAQQEPRTREAIAALIGVSPAAISQWRHGRVPAERVLKLAEATGWEVTPHMLDDKLYPHEWDGVPFAVRRRRRRAPSAEAA